MTELFLLNVHCGVATKKAIEVCINFIYTSSLYGCFKWCRHHLKNKSVNVKTDKALCYRTFDEKTNQPLMNELMNYSAKIISSQQKNVNMIITCEREIVQDLMSSIKSMSHSMLRVYYSRDYSKWCETKTMVYEINNNIFNLIYVSFEYHDRDISNSCYNRLNVMLTSPLGGGMFCGFRKLWIRRLVTIAIENHRTSENSTFCQIYRVIERSVHMKL